MKNPNSKKDTRAEITNFIGNLVFFVWPFLVGYFLFLLFPLSTNEGHGLFGAMLAALTGCSFTAGFFLVALPRTGYLKRLDAKNLTLQYTVAILLPAILAILALSFTAVCESTDKFKCHQWVGDYLIFSAVVYFLWSTFIILKILKNYRSSP